MCVRDMKVAVFTSPFAGGGVRLWYCPHNHQYELRYTVRFCTLAGTNDCIAACTYDAADSSQVADLMLDAIDIARTPLLERD